MSSIIVAYLIDKSKRKYKIEEVKKSTFLGDSSYSYNVLYENNDLLYKDFSSKKEAIRYLEEHKGACSNY